MKKIMNLDQRDKALYVFFEERDDMNSHIVEGKERKDCFEHTQFLQQKFTTYQKIENSLIV